MNKFIYFKKVGVYYHVENVLSIGITFDEKKLMKLFHRRFIDEKTDFDKNIWLPVIYFTDKKYFALSNVFFTYKESEELVNKYFDFLNDPDKQVFVIDYAEGD